MKNKLTSFLVLLTVLLMSGTAFARVSYVVSNPTQVTDLGNLSESNYYVLQNIGSSKYNYYDAANNQMDAKDNYDYSCVVRLIYDGSNVQILQVSTNSYYQGLKEETRITLGNEPVNYTFNTTGVSSGQFRFANNNLYMNRYGGDTQYPTGAATSWAGDFSRWIIYQVEVAEVEMYDITYNVVYEGEVVATATAIITQKEAPALPSSLQNNYIDVEGYYADPSLQTIITEVNKDGDIYVKTTLKDNCPVVFSNGDDKTWYHIKLRNTKYLYYGEGKDAIESQDIAIGESAKWAFVGNPYSVKVINQASNGKYLTHSGTTLSWSDTATEWVMDYHPQYPGKGFQLYHVVGGKTYTIYYGTNGVLALEAAMTSSNDNPKGGGIDVEEINDEYNENVLAELTPYFSNAIGSYFGLSEEKANELKTTYPYWDGNTSCTEAQYETLRNAILQSVRYPETGYYRIQNSAYKRYLGKENTLATLTDGTGASTVVYLKKDTNGNYSITSQGTIDNGYSSLSIDVVEPGLATLKNNDSSQPVYAYWNANENGTLSTWSNQETKAYWSVDDATEIIVSLNTIESDENAYATLCVPFALDDTEGVAYTVAVEGTTATPTSVDGTIEAGLPVLLVGSEATATFTIAGTAPVAAPLTTTGLTGVFTSATIDGAANYVLGTDKTKVGFFHWDGTTLGANRAYIAVPTENEVKGFYLDFSNMTDGITAIENETKTDAIYNLSGQRVSKAQKGIYIVNGKKMLVK